jgi:hypothetical protein
MAATSIIHPRYGIPAALKILHLPSPNSRFVYFRTGPKNTAQLRTLFALANLVIVKKTLFAQGVSDHTPTLS